MAGGWCCLFQIVTYFFFVIYTLGTLSAYALTITNTTLDIVHPVDTDEWTIIGIDAYYVFLFGFAVIVTPFCFGNFQNTKILQVRAPLAGSSFASRSHETLNNCLRCCSLLILCRSSGLLVNFLQIVVVVVRFVAYAIMLVCPLIFVIAGDPVPPYNPSNSSTAAASLGLGDSAAETAVRRLLSGNSSGTNSSTPWNSPSFWFNFEGISSVYGTAIFTFMIHHSIPGLVSPIRPEKWGKSVVGYTMLLVAIMYESRVMFVRACFVRAVVSTVAVSARLRCP